MYREKTPTWDDVLNHFDLQRIKNIPLTEKFRLVEYIKMLAQEAAVLEGNEYEGFGQVSLERKDDTYSMFVYLFEQNAPIRDFKEIILNYLDNYEFSDVYYAKLAIIGLGIMLFYQKRDPFTIFNALLTLLGQDFLTYNFKYYGYQEALATPVNPKTIIRYKEYEFAYRKTKYDLLAFNYMAKEQGLEVLEEYIHQHYGDDKMRLLFTLLHDVHPEIRYRSYKRLVHEASALDQMILSGIYSILTNKGTILAHYMMNSRIGKFDHSGQRPDAVKKEAYDIYLSMMEQMEGAKNDA